MSVMEKKGDGGAWAVLERGTDDGMLSVIGFDRLINVSQVAELLACSERTVWRWRHGALMPPGITIGRVVRWSCRRIMEWIGAGCPSVAKMERSA